MRGEGVVSVREGEPTPKQASGPAAEQGSRVGDLGASSGTARLEAFSDGVFAVAITLLVLELKVPPPEGVTDAAALARALARAWPSYLGYAISFATVGIMWANHHHVFTFVRRSDHGLLVWNGALLFCVVLVPFSTAVLAAYLPVPDARSAAAVLYGAVFALTGVVYNALWRHAAAGGRLLDPAVDPARVRQITRQFAAGPWVYVLATGLALVNVWASLAVHGALAALFLVLPGGASGSNVAPT